MNAVQNEKLDRAADILGEHFEAFAIVALSKKDDGTNCLNAKFGGGYYTVQGLLHEAIEEMRDGDDE